MSSQERPQPAWEQLRPDEIDFTGVVDQTDLLLDAIERALIAARDDGGHLPDWGARVIARHLANYQRAGATALHQLAVTGEATISELMDELASLHFSPNRPAHIDVSVNALGHFILRRIEGAIDAPAPGLDGGPR